MSSTSVLSGGQSEVAATNINDDNHKTNAGDNKQPLKTTKYVKVYCNNGKIKTTEKTDFYDRLSSEHIDLLDMKKTQFLCSDIPVKTVKCSVFEPPDRCVSSCKTYRGHVEKTTSGKHLYCRTHSLFTNCVLNPNANDPIPFARDRLLRTQRHPKPSILKDLSRNQLFVLMSLAIGDFISSCSMSIMAPFFPKEATEKGMGVTVSGFVFSFYALGMFIMSPIVGKILPKIGAKPLFILGLFLAGFSNLLFGFLPVINDYYTFTAACFLIRGLEAIGAGAFSTASFVFVVEVFPDNISTVLGILETFIGLGMSVGPAIGGILYSIGGFGLPFFVLGITMILVVPVNFWFLPTIVSKSKGGHGSFWKILKIPSIFIIGLMVVVSSSIWSFLDPTLEPHLRQLHLTSKQVGLVFLLFSSIYGVFSLIWGWLADRVGNHWSMMVIGQLSSVVCLLTLGPSPVFRSTPNTLSEILTSLSLLGISVALTLMPTFQALLQCAIQNGHKRELTTYSIIAGAWSCMYSLGEVLGPMFGGVLLDKYGFPMCSTVMAAMTLMVGLGSLIFFILQSTYIGITDVAEERKPLLKKEKNEKYAKYTDLAGDSCVIFVPTRSP